MKTKLSIQTIGKYLRELSVVVIGIAITFGISNWINDRNSRKDLKQYLNTIKLELNTNIEAIEDEINMLDESVSYTRYLLSQSKESLNSDSIQKYEHAITRIRSFNPKYNAFEMFKSSGIMRLINDKELLLSIWGAYSEIEDIQQDIQAYYDNKKDKLEREYVLKLSEKQSPLSLYNFFITRYAISLQERSKDNLQRLKETVAKIDKKS